MHVCCGLYPIYIGWEAGSHLTMYLFFVVVVVFKPKTRMPASVLKQDPNQ